MKIPFHKIHGTNNDFLVVDDRARRFPLGDAAFIQRIAARRTGVGCDGIILLQPSAAADLRMRFINPDGGEQALCGNGARCFARLAHDLGAAPARMRIETGAGTVGAEVLGETVRIELPAPQPPEMGLAAGLPWPVDFIDTGVPHAVAWVEDPAAIDLPALGRAIRRHARFAPQGTNADFARVEADGSVTLRTYERGVEAETLACGTGAVAAAVLAAKRGVAAFPITVHCAGGFDLVVDAAPGRILLSGGAQYVYSGEVEHGDRV